MTAMSTISASALLLGAALPSVDARTIRTPKFPRAFQRVPVFDAAAPPRPSTVNCTWTIINQPLSHWDASSPKAIPQRVCIYDKYWGTAEQGGYKAKSAQTKGPVFFYTGNESPVDLYVNNTGIMWELGKVKHALLVFSEHRFFGESYPGDAVTECYGGIGPTQALKDHAVVIEHIRSTYGLSADHPVFAFGGSYGGMLTAWLKNVYPTSISGGLAASAPLTGFANFGEAEGTSRAGGFITRPWVDKYSDGKYCADNLRGLFVLGGLGLVTVPDIPLADLAEASYGFPSTYFTEPGEPWPAFPVSVICKSAFGTTQYFDFCDPATDSNCRFEEVKFTFKLAKGSNATVTVDWTNADAPYDISADLDAAGIPEMINALNNALQQLFSGDETHERATAKEVEEARGTPTYNYCPTAAPNCPQTDVYQAGVQCLYDAAQYAGGGAWEFCVENADTALVQYFTTGVGQDYTCPPASQFVSSILPRRWQEIVQKQLLMNFSNQDDLPGVATTGEWYSPWMQGYLNKALDKIPNIMWSNGRLDPWAGGGVYPGLNPYGYNRTEALANITASGSSQSLLIDYAGHHVDLFFTHPDQPKAYTEARSIETQFMDRVIQDAYNLQI